MAVSQWHMNRLGLVDFWCYENEEFDFYNGHMLLRGSNGSGKSVTMQSFIPLLLDGNKSPERLDPFGSRARKMDTYLIDENSSRDDRTGYLYLEFKREDSEIYKTIGMGIHARKNKNLEVWYFVIEDNRRVNVDFSLIESHLTLTKKQLENILGNQVISGQKQYMSKVNEALFGFQNIDDYKDAIDLLLQLRSPKLSNSLSPSKINELLESSLQPLSEDDLRPMSEAISSMDNLQDELESLNNSFQSATKISQAYTRYNQAILLDKYSKYKNENELYLKIEKDIDEKSHAIVQLEKQIEQDKNELSQSKIDLEVKLKEKNILMDPQIEKLHDEYISLQKKQNELKEVIDQKEELFENKDNKMIDIKNDIEDYQRDIDLYHQKREDTLKILDNIYETFPFSEHVILKDTLKNQQEYDFSYTFLQLKEEEQNTQNAMTQYRQYLDKKTKIQNIEDDIMHIEDEIQILNHDYDKKKKAYHQVVEDYQEYFYHFQNQNQVLKLSNQQVKMMTEKLVDYETSHEYRHISDIVYQQYLVTNEQLLNESNRFKYRLKEVEEQLHEYENDYQIWKDKKEIEPDRDTLTLKQRNTLIEQHIDFIPFYQLLDFSNDVDDHQKNIIEELLMQMKILDAIVVHKTNQEMIKNFNFKGHDYYLWTKKSLQDLETVSLSFPLTVNQLQNIFSQLGIDMNHDFMIENHYFQSGLLEGNTDQGKEACFIGLSRRQLLRQNKLDELSQLINTYKQKQETLLQSIQTCQNNMKLLKQEMESFRNDDVLKSSYLEIEKCVKEIHFLEDKLQKQIELKIAERQKANQLLENVKEQCQYLLVDISQEALTKRILDIEEYKNKLNELKYDLSQEEKYLDLKNIKMENLVDLQIDLDQLSYDIYQSKQEKDINEGNIASIEQQLEQFGYQDIQNQLQILEKEIQNLQEVLNHLEQSMIRSEEKEKYLNQDLLIKKEELNKQKIIKNNYYQVLMQEVDYGFIISDKKDVLEQLKILSQNIHPAKTVMEYLTALQNVFFEQIAYLSQYHLSHEMDALVCDLEDVQGHFIIKATHQGKKISLFELLDILQKRIESQKLLIVQEDRHIFEEILVNTIGEKIRNRIQSSQRWVDKMEKYMHDMNTSSGLQLSLKWKSKKALDDDEMDTAQLVQLLEKDYRILKENDRQKISSHFRKKIEKARRLSLDENTTSSFHQLIKEVMDYRKWFEFTLYAKKPNESKKELTNRMFYAFSGGEKAIAMYVPLFSAVAAKFESANEDAPHLIALDEAFAGVDEKNIDSLFGLITKFNFDYIMNSQVLWGDYASCHSLAIYELFRPDNAPFVTKVAYQWNGNKRRAVFK